MAAGSSNSVHAAMHGPAQAMGEVGGGEPVRLSALTVQMDDRCVPNR